MLLKTLGILSDNLTVSDDALALLRSVFDSPLQELQLRAIAAIFGKAIPFNLASEMESARTLVV